MTPSPKMRSKVRLSDGGGAVLTSPGTGSFCFSGDAAGRKLGLHDLRSGDAIIHHGIAPDVPTVVATSHDSAKCAFGTDSGALFVWDVQFPTMMEAFRPDGADGLPAAGARGARDPAARAISALAWHPRGHAVAAGGAGGALTVWDMVLGAPVWAVEGAHAGGVAGLAWTAHGRALASVGADGSLKVWNARHGAVAAMIDGAGGDAAGWHAGAVTCVDAITDMSRVAVSGGEDGSVFLSVLKPAEKDACGVFCSPRGHAGAAVTAVRIAPLESVRPLRCASGASDGSVQLFDMDRKMPMGAFKHGGGGVKQIEFNYDGNVLFSGAGDNVKAWDARVVPEESPEVTFGAEVGAAVSSFCVANAGASLIIGTDDGMLRMYDMRYPAGNVPLMPATPVPSGIVNR